jgi:hypothetical protein
MASCTFFGKPVTVKSEQTETKPPVKPQYINFSESGSIKTSPMSNISSATFDASQEYIYHKVPTKHKQWVLLEFETPVSCPLNSVVIGSKLDTDVSIFKYS